MGPTVPHSREALQQTVNIPQTSIIPPLTVLLSVESLPIKKKKNTKAKKPAVFQTFLPISDPEVRAALGW